MPKNYSDYYYLTGVDVAELIQGYHQAYVEKYPKHELHKVDDRFWQNDKGEVIFYAGEQTLVDINSEGITQQVGRGFYDATLAMTARFLELDTPMLPSENMYVISLINFDRGHWTSAILSLKNINEEKYQEIYGLYQEFKQFLKTKHPDFKFERGEQSCTNLFVQYATGNRHGAVVGIKNKTEIDNYICEFFISIGRQDLLEVQGLLEAERYVEGDLKLVLEPEKSSDIGVYHFDSMLSTTSNQRLEQACARFLNANDTRLLMASNIPRQTGATCGEHSILNAFKYVFFGLTNTISSSDLRKGTNHFCTEIAKLFLLDYDSKTFKENYERMIAEQLEKEKNAPIVTNPEIAKNEKTSPAWLFASGVMLGISITVLSTNLIAPMLGIVNPILGTLFSAAVGLVTAGLGYIIIDELQEWDVPVIGALFQNREDDTEDKILEALSEKKHQLEYADKNKQVAPTTNVLGADLGDKPQTFTPMLAATVTPLPNTTVVNANTTETKKVVSSL